MKRLIPTTLGLYIMIAAHQVHADDMFSRIKTRLAEADCIRFEFLSVLESEVFDAVDTAKGNVVIAADSRYCLDLGRDQYIFDGRLLYSFSRENNQVTVEAAASGEAQEESVSFVKRIDEFYSSTMVVPDERYRLIRLSEKHRELPDTVVAFVDPQSESLARLEYYDVNGDLNRIIFTAEEILPTCSDSAFVPSYPDSVEIIKL
ncbi:MAG: hypothetical protein JSU65_06350 [Candidatus Zixiibacteriota bacterium]|nr:MAG: hypothetical protein JSU65_06350 [candidate division Zixibacteria bacterium]